MRIEDHKEIVEAVNTALSEEKIAEVKFEGDNLTVVSYKPTKRRKTASVNLRLKNLKLNNQDG